MEITDTTSEIEEEMGYEHGKLDATTAMRPWHLSDSNPVAWDDATAAYRTGYEAGWKDSQVSINER
jgi:hypothetical protein